MYIIYDLGRYTCNGTKDFFYKYQTLVLLPKHFFEYIKTKLITAPKMFFLFSYYNFTCREAGLHNKESSALCLTYNLSKDTQILA